MHYDIYDIDKNALDLIKPDADTNIFCGDFLLKNIDKKYNYIITNPPYIAYKNISDGTDDFDRDLYIENILNTFDITELGITEDDLMKKHSDLYIYFFLKCLTLLEDNGELIFLCSDSWFDGKFGDVLKRVLTENFYIETIVNSHYYPFFNEYTNAIVTKIKKKTAGTEHLTTVYSIMEPRFVLTKELDLKQEDMRHLFFTEANTKNSLIITPAENRQIEEFGRLNQKKLIVLEDCIDISTNGVDFKGLVLSKDRNDIPVFFQNQARVNKPANYKINYEDKDMKNFIKKSDIPEKYQKNIIEDGCFFNNVINKYPLVFSYKGHCLITSKYRSYKFKGVIDKRLLPLVFTNIITIAFIERNLKNSNKRSSTKNENGVIKEIRSAAFNKLLIPDFSRLSIKEVDNIIYHFDRYKNLQIFDLEVALKNDDYMMVQKMLFEYLDIKYNIIYFIDILKGMFYKRMRNLNKLGLELVD